MQRHSQTIHEHGRTFLPAAGHDWLLPLYDPFVKLLGGDRVRKALIDQAGIQPNHKVLEIGCGTGSLVTAIKRSQPQAEVTGLDPDPRALERAKRKAHRNALTIHFEQGFSDQLPYADDFFDRVVSSFMFHHLNDGEKEKTLREVRRVLKSGGSFHMVDFEKSESGGGIARLFHSSERLKDNTVSRILTFLRDAGFENPEATRKAHLLFMPVVFYRS
jgi:ubiquinone/menaquinone biosynthesis C-methylase UbiE